MNEKRRKNNDKSRPRRLVKANKVAKSPFSCADFLVTSAIDMKKRKIDQLDIIFITADAYIDHPSFGVALLGRYLEHLGYKVGVIAQPDWKSADDFGKLGSPRLFWGITSGAVDSRLNNYSSMGHKRKDDAYSPGGQIGLRPDKPLLAYGQRARQVCKDVPLIIGGLEASLRRMAHYDYIEDKIKRSVLTDSKADLLVHGMGENAIEQIARRLNDGESIETLTDIPGTAFRMIRNKTAPAGAIEIPSLQAQQENPEEFMKAHLLYQDQANPDGKAVIQDQDGESIVILPPAEPLTTEQMDLIYSFKYTRTAHCDYKEKIPALETIGFSITTHRGCFGGCSFCSLYFHQGKHISGRSEQSILDELDRCVAHPDFKGTVSDIGGPSANMYGMECKCEKECKKPSCIFPKVCKQLDEDTAPILHLMAVVQKWKSQQKRKVNIFVASGVRHDLAARCEKYTQALAKDFIGGHLKVAPEHYCKDVLDLMGKPGFNTFEDFENKFNQANAIAGKQQYLVPYFISSHPGSSPEDALRLCLYLLERNWRVRQVQDFTPVPLTLATAMYVSGLDANCNKIYVAKGRREKQLQMAMLKYHQSGSYELIVQYLRENKSVVRKLGINVEKVLASIRRLSDNNS
ncbi:MAG: YgiQ family radical SAM protein [Phycisphaerae bacterium]|nr:YgiQ family radical SAM protein [Phycisphaerae bacterium]